MMTSMEGQSLFNVSVGIAGALGGWVLRVLWESMRELQREDRALIDRVAAIDVLIAGQYVRRDHFETMMDRFFEKLDRIESKLDGKADKSASR